jgi:plastocyanin
MHGYVTDAAKLVIGAAVFATICLGSSTTLTAQNTGAGVRRFELRIENGRVADDRKTIQIQRGDLVELNWSADRHTVLHLHGYDVEVTVAPGETQTMKFRARATGRFPIEAHDRQHKVLLYLEVLSP